MPGTKTLWFSSNGACHFFSFQLPKAFCSDTVVWHPPDTSCSYNCTSTGLALSICRASAARHSR